MPPQVNQDQDRFFPLVLVLAAVKWNVYEQVHFMWVMPIAFFLGVVFPLVWWGLSRPNNRLTHVPIASNADCSAGVPLRATREVSGASTQVPTSPVVLTNQPWVAPVVSCKAQACEYSGMMFSTRAAAQVPNHGNMSALEGDAVINSSPAMDLFKESKRVTSTRSPPKLLQGMAMHKAMQRVYDLPAPKFTTAATTTTSSTSASSSALTLSASASSSSALASSSTSSASTSASLDELCQALTMLDIHEPDTQMPDAIPGTPEQLREIVEIEDASASEPEVEDTIMGSPSPSPPPSPPLPLPPPPPPAILYTQAIQPPVVIFPEAIPEVVVAAVAAVASAASAAAAIPVASSTGSSNNRSRFGRPTLRPRSRLRWQRPSGDPPPPLPRPPPSPPRPPLISSSPPPQPPTPPASTSSAMAYEDTARPIARPRRRLQRQELVPPPPSSSSSLPPPPPSSSSSALPSLARDQPAPPPSISQNNAAESDSCMLGDDILEEILGSEEDPYDTQVFEDTS